MKKIIKFVVVLSEFLLAGCNTGNLKKQSDIENKEDMISLEEFCATNLCRENIRIKFRHENGQVDEALPLFWPVVQGGSISIVYSNHGHTRSRD